MNFVQNNIKHKKIFTHPWHLVDNSPWPFIMSIAVLNTAIGFILYLFRIINAGFTLFFSIIAIIICLIFWWRDIIREATFEGKHTLNVQKNLRLGVILFIISEIMFFFGFFWAFFHNSLSPAIQIGAIWPPIGINPINPFGIPFLNTCILLTSGASLTAAHHYLRTSVQYLSFMFQLTLFLAIWFTLEQFIEYAHASFNISDGIYGSIFYMATGFHGFHVIIGTIFIWVAYERFIRGHFTKEHHIGFEAAAWYWHFVDVVWLFLFISIYWWGYGL
jgi:cytochrome c oxidase subunit 3